MTQSPPGSVRGALLLVLAVGISLAQASPGSPAGNAGRQEPGRVSAARPDSHPRAAIIAVDAADWRIIDPLVAAGRLPAFARLKKAAALGVLKADPPLLSPIIWTTVATGRSPEDHGVLDFMVDVPGGSQVPVHGGVRRAKAIWEIWSEASRSVLVAGWWATWPADRVRGVIVSDRLSNPHVRDLTLPNQGLVHPSEALAGIVRQVVRPSAIDYSTLSRFVPLGRAEFEKALGEEAKSSSRLYRNPIAHLRAALAAARTWRAVVAGQLEGPQPDLVIVYYELIDIVSHLFVRDRARGERAIASAYEEVDAALAEVAGLLDPATLVLVLSDHGFYPADAGIREDPSDLTSGATAWHRPYGVFGAIPAGVLAGKREPGASSPWVGTVSPVDIVPTLLAHARLPVAADMSGRVIPGVTTAGPVLRVPSYGAHVMPGSTGSLGKEADRAEMERLRALGYVSGAAGTTSLARTNLGEILYRKGDLRGAIRELEAVARAEPLNDRASLWLARSYAAAGRPDDAIRVYERMIRAAAHGSEPDGLVFLAATELDLQAGRVSAAEARLQRVPASLARAPEVLVAAGTVAEAEGKRPAAERSYREALNAAPSYSTALQRLVDLLIGDGRAGMARTIAARMAQTYPSSPTHLALVGHAALAMKQYKDAARWFEAALALAPDADSVKVELARANLLGGRPAEAVEALSGTRPSLESQSLLGAALSATHDWAGAMAAFEFALSAGKPTAELLNALGYAQLQAGRPRDAARTLERSLALAPDQPEVRALLETARKR